MSLDGAPNVYKNLIASSSSSLSKIAENDERVPLTKSTTLRRYIFVLVALALLIVTIVYIFVELTRSWLETSRRDNESKFKRTRDFNNVKLRRLFDPAYGNSRDTTNEDKVSRDRDRATNMNLLGPLLPNDCDANRVVCLNNDNCKLLCKNSSVINYTCNERNICQDRSVIAEESNDNDGGKGSGIGISDNDETGARNCDAKNGEFALLQGYNEIGLAQWNCVNIYPGWQDKTKYCEKGIIDIDARVREPSYADCKCPRGTTRMIYRKSMIGQTVYGLPHCVENPKFFEFDYVEI